ncbi:MAG: paraquat-inducible protein A, partial [Chthoniobacteraceae bacterium]
MSPPAVFTAAAHGLAICHACGKVQPVAAQHCHRCNATLHLRKPHSLQRTWALTIAAAIMYFPANLLPI